MQLHLLSWPTFCITCLKNGMFDHTILCNHLIHKSLLVCRIVNEVFQVIESNSNMFPPKSNMDCESKQM
jgi:hypothetical protein